MLPDKFRYINAYIIIIGADILWGHAYIKLIALVSETPSDTTINLLLYAIAVVWFSINALWFTGCFINFQNKFASIKHILIGILISPFWPVIRKYILN
jgi:hypothetical protein